MTFSRLREISECEYRKSRLRRKRVRARVREFLQYQRSGLQTSPHNPPETSRDHEDNDGDQASMMTHVFHDDPPAELNGDEAGPLSPVTLRGQSGLLGSEGAEGLRGHTVAHISAGAAALTVG